MDRIEAIKALNRFPVNYTGMTIDEANRVDEALAMAARALRPVSRERVEKAEWIWSTGDVYICSSCGEKTHVDECMENPIYNFCPFCMAAMTDESVEMVMERLEALHENRD